MIPGVVVTADGGLAFDPEIAGDRSVLIATKVPSVKASVTADELVRMKQWWKAAINGRPF